MIYAGRCLKPINNNRTEFSDSTNRDEENTKISAAMIHKTRYPSAKIIVWIVRLSIILCFLEAWQIVGTHSDYYTLVFSSPALVFETLVHWLADRAWWSNLGVTLEEAGLGYMLGVSLALMLVAAVAPSPVLGRFLAPFIAALNALPKIALAPLFILWFGTRLQSKVYFVASLICFIVFYGVLNGLRTIDGNLLANARILGASRINLLIEVYIPAIVTWLIASLRLSAAWALLASVIVEYLGSTSGLGYLIATGQQTLQANVVIAGILVVACVSVALDRLLTQTEARMMRWRAF
jgi:ABC-type nitrate/sulfonate/bicarbonate transport system permease component